MEKLVLQTDDNFYYLFFKKSKSNLPQSTGETFILFNKQMKGNKRELVQFGIPIFGQIKEEATSNTETSKTSVI